MGDGQQFIQAHDVASYVTFDLSANRGTIVGVAVTGPIARPTRFSGRASTHSSMSV